MFFGSAGMPAAAFAAGVAAGLGGTRRDSLRATSSPPRPRQRKTEDHLRLPKGHGNRPKRGAESLDPEKRFNVRSRHRFLLALARFRILATRMGPVRFSSDSLRDLNCSIHFRKFAPEESNGSFKVQHG
jgi:hypothetical protein